VTDRISAFRSRVPSRKYRLARHLSSFYLPELSHLVSHLRVQRHCPKAAIVGGGGYRIRTGSIRIKSDRGGYINPPPSSESVSFSSTLQSPIPTNRQPSAFELHLHLHLPTSSPPFNIISIYQRHLHLRTSTTPSHIISTSQPHLHLRTSSPSSSTIFTFRHHLHRRTPSSPLPSYPSSPVNPIFPNFIAICATT
jgi:hypothetical protein